MHVVSLVRAQLPADVPVHLGRDEATELARRELADPAYHQDDQPWTLRLIRWIIDRITEALDRIVTASPGGWAGILGLIVVIVAVIAVIRWRVGPLRRADTVTRALFDLGDVPAAEHRRLAQLAAAQGLWADAVREQLRAVVRDLEERGLITPRPGRTADEAAVDGGVALPTVALDLRMAARTFDDIWYGGRVADSASYDRIVAVDRAVEAARPEVVAR